MTTAVLLVDGPNEVRPKVVLGVKEGKVRGRCYLCGDEAYTLDEANQTIFPFLTGPSGVLSFNSEAGRPEKICWKCAFIGKFPPVNGFYLSTRQRDSLFAFFPYSSSFEKMCDVYRSLRDIEYIDPNYYQNFQHPLHVGKATGGFFQRPFEVAFAFFYTLYRKLLVYTEGNADSADVVFDWEKMFDITLSKAPLEFIILHAEKKGDAWIGKMVWPFRDSVYFFRLMNALEDAGVNINDVMRLLIDFSQTKNENKTLVRNRVCERILKKKTALQLVESHAFSADVNYIKPLLDFETAYEPIIRMEDEMKREEQEAAVTLGKRVGMAVGTEGKKGDLFALRKVRKKVDFLNELNRLQFKYDLSVPPDVYGGKLTDENFVEFKQFCMLAALNSFNAKQHPKGGT